MLNRIRAVGTPAVKGINGLKKIGTETSPIIPKSLLREGEKTNVK